ncbi:hypothetical protein GCM10023324_32620 [Streptomyces youssoufiensis]
MNPPGVAFDSPSNVMTLLGSAHVSASAWRVSTVGSGAEVVVLVVAWGVVGAVVFVVVM